MRIQGSLLFFFVCSVLLSVLFTEFVYEEKANAQASNSWGTREELTELLRTLYKRDFNKLPHYNDYQQCVSGKLKDETQPPKIIAAQMTPVSPQEAMALFQEFKDDEGIPFRYAEDGCYARTFQMHRITEKKGIKMGSIYIEGDFNVKTPKSISPQAHWQYHVAPVIPVYTDIGQAMMVIDPSLFDAPVTVPEWRDTIVDEDDDAPYCLFYSNRFSVEPDDLPVQEITYRNRVNTEDELTRVRKILKEYDKMNDIVENDPWVEGVSIHQVSRTDRLEMEIGEHDGVYYLDRERPNFIQMLKMLKKEKNRMLSFQVNPVSLEIVSIQKPKIVKNSSSQ